MKRWWPLAILILAALVAIAADSCDSNCGSVRLPYLGDVCGRGGGGAGGTAVPTATNSPTPTPTPGATPTPVSVFQETLGSFSFREDSSCEMAAAIDPITIVFFPDGVVAASHVLHHGLTSPPPPPLLGGSPQRFWDSGQCRIGDLDLGENSGGQACFATPPVCPIDRWHIRGQWSTQTGSYTWSGATPHFDKAVSQNCWHVVPNQYDGSHGGYPPYAPGVSGFTAGREWVAYQFILGGHQIMGSEYWGNVHYMRQCNGEWSRSDGTVYFIEVVRP